VTSSICVNGWTRWRPGSGRCHPHKVMRRSARRGYTVTEAELRKGFIPPWKPADSRFIANGSWGGAHDESYVDPPAGGVTGSRRFNALCCLTNVSSIWCKKRHLGHSSLLVPSPLRRPMPQPMIPCCSHAFRNFCSAPGTSGRDEWRKLPIARSYSKSGLGASLWERLTPVLGIGVVPLFEQLIT